MTNAKKNFSLGSSVTNHSPKEDNFLSMIQESPVEDLETGAPSEEDWELVSLLSQADSALSLQ